MLSTGAYAQWEHKGEQTERQFIRTLTWSMWPRYTIKEAILIKLNYLNRRGLWIYGIVITFQIPPCSPETVEAIRNSTRLLHVSDVHLISYGEKESSNVVYSLLWLTDSADVRLLGWAFCSEWRTHDIRSRSLSSSADCIRVRIHSQQDHWSKVSGFMDVDTGVIDSECW